jgi:biofilm protein TabA
MIVDSFVHAVPAPSSSPALTTHNHANRAWYASLPSRFRRALEMLASTDLKTLTLGRHDLEGDALFVLVQEYTTKPEEVGRWEAHRRYADIQLLVRGQERIGVAPIEHMTVDVPYDETNDVALFTGQGDWLTMVPGRFAIFFPQDVHLPCIQAGTEQTVRKIVVKVELDR